MQIEEYLVEDQETLEEMEARLETLDSTYKCWSAAAQECIVKASRAIDGMDKTWQLWRKLASEIEARHREIIKQRSKASI